MLNKIIKLSLLILAFSTVAIYAQQDSIFISESGLDTNPGTFAEPLATLKGAQEKITAMHEEGTYPASGLVVAIRGGKYTVTSTVTFNEGKAGKNGAPLTFTRYKNEKVIFDGMKLLTPTDFSVLAADAKLHANAGGNVYVQTITDATLISALQKTDAQMSFNDTLMSAARFPNLGYGHMNDGTIDASGEVLNGVGTETDPKGAKFKMLENFDATKWNAEMGRIHKAFTRGYSSSDWRKDDLRIYDVASDGTIHLMDGSAYGVKDRTSPNRLYVVHMLCELDEPGEWYFDDTDNKLYVWPLSPMNENTSIGVWSGATVLEFVSAEYVNVQRLIFQNLGTGRNGDGAVNMTGSCKFIEVAGCTFRNIAPPMTSVNILSDCRYCGVRSSDFYDVSNNTRLYGGTVSSKEIKYGHNYIINCHFTQLFSKDFYGKSSGINGAGNIFRNNLIHNMNGQTVTHTGCDHVFELNEVFNTGVEEGDGGAFYTGASLTSFGNLIQHNFMHHMMSVPKLLGRASFFSDDFDAGETVQENVTYKGGWETIKHNQGGAHSVYRNVVMESAIGIRFGNGGTSVYDRLMTYIPENPHSGDKNNTIGRMLQQIGVVGWDDETLSEENWHERVEPYWLERYPYLQNLLNGYQNTNSGAPYECRVYDNMFFGNTSADVYGGNGVPSIKNSQAITMDIFEDPSVMNFKFKTPRPDYAPDIPFEKIGLYVDEFRTQVPTKDSYRKDIKDHWEDLPCHTNDAYNPATINDRIYYNTGKMVMSYIPESGPTAPTVSFTAPCNGQYFLPEDTIKVSAKASDEGSIVKVALYVNNELVREIASGELKWGYENLEGDTLLRDTTEGLYMLKLVAEDDEGFVSERSIPVFIQKPEVKVPTTNVAVDKPARQSSDNYDVNPEDIAAGKGQAFKAVDGNTDGLFNNGSVTHTKNDYHAWWEVDLENHYQIKDIGIWNRINAASRVTDFHVLVSDVPFLSEDLVETIRQDRVIDIHVPGQAKYPTEVEINAVGRYVRVQLSKTNFLSLAEVEVLCDSLNADPVAVPSDIPPYANAGERGTVLEGAVYTLDGTNSYHPFDEEITSYTWTAPAGIILDDASSATPSFTAPLVDALTDYVFELTVACGEKTSASHSVTVTIKNRPEADAGPDQEVAGGAMVILDGSGSFDPDGNNIDSYLWTAPEEASLDNNSSTYPIFFAPEPLHDSVLVFSLVVTSNDVESMADTVEVTVLGSVSVDNNLTDTYHIYPNPLTNGEKLNIETGISGEYMIEVYDIYGRMILQNVVHTSSYQLDLTKENLQGEYFLKIRTKDNSSVLKFSVLQ